MKAEQQQDIKYYAICDDDESRNSIRIMHAGTKQTFLIIWVFNRSNGTPVEMSITNSSRRPDGSFYNEFRTDKDAWDILKQCDPMSLLDGLLVNNNVCLFLRDKGFFKESK